MSKAKLEGRIRYVENWHDDGEHYLFEIKWSDEKDWGLESAFKLFPHVSGGDNEMIHYTALTKIREWQRLNIDFHFE